MTAKQITRRIAWWASLLFLVLLTVSWIGSYITAIAVCLPTTGKVTYTHALDFCEGYSIYVLDGEVCILPFTFSPTFRFDFSMDPQIRSEIKRDFIEDARREATQGMVFSFQNGLFLFPLWMPLVAFGIPFALFTRRSIVRARLKTDGIVYRWMPNTRSKRICLPLAALVFAAALWVSFEAGKGWLIERFGHDFLNSISRRFGISDRVIFGVALAAWLVFSYAVARISYTLFRRKRIPISENNAPLCLSCRYVLTGNTSDVCPECGTPVESKSSRAPCLELGDANAP